MELRTGLVEQLHGVLQPEMLQTGGMAERHPGGDSRKPIPLESGGIEGVAEEIFFYECLLKI